MEWMNLFLEHWTLSAYDRIALLFSLILMVGLFCQWIAWRITLPAIIFLLVSGVVLGPIFGWVTPHQIPDEVLFPFISFAVAIILFEGSMCLKFRDIHGLRRVIRNLITLGALITWLLTALATRWIFMFSWQLCFLFAALMVVTGPTVIIPMLRSIRPKENVAKVLRWEGILIDPIGAILAVLVFELVISGGNEASFAIELIVFSNIILLGLALGLLGGYVLSQLLKHYWLPHFLKNFAALAMVSFVFSVSNALEEESGLLAVTVMGVYLGNLRHVDLDDILNFKESLSVLLISMLFILLAARIDLFGLTNFGWAALTLFLSIQFVIRPACVYVCAMGSQLTASERHLIAWIAPKGIVAAAMSALFALKLESLGFKDAYQLVPLTFLMIVGTVLLQSFTAGFLAKWLHVSAPEARGFLIIGANPVSIAIALQLKKNDIPVLLVDENWEYTMNAKMKELPSYWGNPVSEHAEKHLELGGLGYVLVITPSIDLNALVLEHYRLEFDPGHLYFINNVHNETNSDKERVQLTRGGARLLFNKTITYEILYKKLNEGADIKTTKLTEEFTFDDYLASIHGDSFPMFALDLANRVHVFSPKANITPAPGWKIIGFSHAQCFLTKDPSLPLTS